MSFRFLVLLFLAGCAGPGPERLDPEKSEADFRSRSLSEPGLRRFLEENLGREFVTFPPASWDPKILTLVAFYYHPELDLARARLALGKAGIRTARAWPNPTVGVDLEKVTNPTSGVSPWVYGFNLSLPLDTLWKRGYRIELAEHLAAQARFELGLAGWHVRSRLRAALAEHLLAIRELDLRRLEETVRSEVVEAQKRRLAVGAVFRLDVDRAEGELAAARAAIHAAQGQVAESRAILAGALGVPIRALEGATLAWPQIDKPPPVETLPLAALRKAGMVNRLDLLGLLAEYDAAEAALKLEVAKQYPDVTLGPGFLSDQGDRKVTLGLSITLPILDQNQGPIAEAVARRKETAARFLALQADVIGVMEAALERYRYALQEMAETEKTLASLERREQAVRRSIDAGAEDRVALVGVRLETVVGSLSRLTVLRKAQGALGALEDSLQGPLDEVGIFPAAKPENPRTPEKRDDHP